MGNLERELTQVIFISSIKKTSICHPLPFGALFVNGTTETQPPQAVKIKDYTMAEELNNQAEAQEQEQNNAANEAQQNAEETVNETKAEEKVIDPLTELQEKYDTLNKKYLLLYSDFENYRKRTAKEKLDSLKNAGSGTIEALIPVVDDFDRAIAANEHNDDPVALKEGFELIHNKLYHVLQQKGLKPMDSIGKDFDTEFHEAITNIPAPSAEMKGKVVDVAEKGYFHNDTVLRYAKVIVGQ